MDIRIVHPSPAGKGFQLAEVGMDFLADLKVNTPALLVGHVL